MTKAYNYKDESKKKEDGIKKISEEIDNLKTLLIKYKYNDSEKRFIESQILQLESQRDGKKGKS